MSWSGFYINLDRSTDRDARMRAQLEALSLEGNYARFPAVDGAEQTGVSSRRSAGEVGCFLSHLGLLRQNLGGDHLHVLEDDAILSGRTASVIERIIANGVLDEYDIIMTDAHVGGNLATVIHFKKIVAASLQGESRQGDGSLNIKIIDISNQDFATTSSYLVNRNSVAKICGLLASEVAAGMRAPVDLLLRWLANNGHLRVGLTMPLVTTVPLHNITPSTIHTPDEDIMRLSSTLVRRALYVECDAEASLREAAQYANPSTDGRDELIFAAIKLRLQPD